MPNGRRLRGLRPREVIRAFEKLGYRVDRVSGSHYILEHLQRSSIQIPFHGVVKTGLLRDMIKRTRFSIQEFLKGL